MVNSPDGETHGRSDETVCETKLSTVIIHLHGGGEREREKNKNAPSAEQMTSHVTWSDPTSGPPLVGSEADKRVMMTHEFFNQIKRGSDRSGRQSFQSRRIHPRLSNDSAPVADAILASTAAGGSRPPQKQRTCAEARVRDVEIGTPHTGPQSFLSTSRFLIAGAILVCAVFPVTATET